MKRILGALTLAAVGLTSGVLPVLGQQEVIVLDDEDVILLEDVEVIEDVASDRQPEDALVWNSNLHASVDRALSVPLPRTVRKGYLQFVIEHRNRTPVDEDTWDNFFGFDGGNLKIGLGMYYGLLDHLDVGVYRLNGTVESFDTWQFSAKWQALQEDIHFLDAAVIGGGTTFTVAEDDDDAGGFGGLIAGHSFGSRIYASAGGLFHSNSSSLTKTTADKNDSTAVLGSLSAHLTPRTMLVGEFSTPVDGYEANTTAWAVGFKYVTHGHTFSFIAGNTQYISLDGLAAGTAFDDDEVVLGFSITRDVRLPGRMGKGLF